MASCSHPKMKKKLPERLAQVRGDRSQRQFARELGVFQQNVNRYENGTTPHADFLITLAIKEKRVPRLASAGHGSHEAQRPLAGRLGKSADAQRSGVEARAERSRRASGPIVRCRCFQTEPERRDHSGSVSF